MKNLTKEGLVKDAHRYKATRMGSPTAVLVHF
jgi:hypothetical protein